MCEAAAVETGSRGVGGKRLGMNPGNKERQNAVVEEEGEMRAVSGNGVGMVMCGDGGILACAIRVLQPLQPLQAGKA